MNFTIKFEKEIKRIKDSWNNYPFFASICVFILIFLVYSSIYLNNPGISFLDDHLFHFKYAYLLRTSGHNVIDNFNWVYYSKTARDHLGFPLSLFNLTLIPFTFFKDMILGLKLSDIFLASLGVSLLYFVFRRSKVKMPLLFIFFLMSSEYFIARMLSGRAMVLTIALVFLEIYLATKKEYRKFFFVALFHILWHFTTAFFPILISGIVELGRYLSVRRFYFKNLIASLSSALIGILLLPQGIRESWRLMVNIYRVHGTTISGTAKLEGSEIYPKDITSMFWGRYEFFFLMAIVGVGLVIYYYISNRTDEREGAAINHEKKESNVLMFAVFIFLIIIILGSIVVSGRLYDFYFPATVFLAALLITRIFNDKKMFVDPKIVKFIMPAILFFLLFSAGNSFINQKIMISRNDYRPWQETAEWVKEKSNDNELVFLQNWSWFAVNFFYNSKNVYTMGLEPRSLHDHSPRLYWEWYNIFAYNFFCEKQGDCAEERGKALENIQELNENEKEAFSKENGKKIVEAVKRDFNTRLIISDSPVFNKNLDLNSNLVEDSFEAKSEYANISVKAFILK